jgi:hypothetical protein
MSTSDLTEFQKDLLRKIVASDDAGKTAQKGVLLINHGSDEYVLWGPQITLYSLSDLEALCDEGLLENISGSSPKYRIKNSARTAVANDFRIPQAQFGSSLSIGTIIGAINGGNVQTIGSVLNSEVSQVINDPKSLQPYLDELAEKLLSEVKAELPVKEYAKYQEIVQDLKHQLSQEKPAISTVKKLLQSISFLGDVEGTVELMLRVWPLIQPFITIIALKLGQAA